MKLVAALKQLNNRQKLAMALTGGFILGFLWVATMRFVLYKNPGVHYHANFALYVNGEQDQFDNFTFYEEVQACGSDEVNNPRTRVHLHDQVGHVAHVHDEAATWGHLFANLGYTLSDNLLKNDDGVFVDDEGDKLIFWLNGEEVDGIANRTIRSEDTLLISYGSENAEVIKQRYDSVTRDAAEYNKRDDPSNCTGTKPASFSERLKAALSFN